MIAHSFGETESTTLAQKQNLPKRPSTDLTLTSRLPCDVTLSSLNLVRDVHLDLLSMESLSALVSVRASLKIDIGLDQVRNAVAFYGRLLVRLQGAAYLAQQFLTICVAQ